MSNGIQDEGPWKWQIIRHIQSVEERLVEVIGLIKEAAIATTHSAKMREAGRKSAEARTAKFGSCRPPGNKKQQETLNLPELVQAEMLPAPRKSGKTKPSGSAVWDSYKRAYLMRHGVEPIRNAKSNSQCTQLVNQLGADLAVSLVEYYVFRNDAFYVSASHPIGLCLSNAQKLVTEMQTGNVVTMADARRIEGLSQNDRAIRQYTSELVQGKGSKNE